jgi:hypothetical protein
MLPLSGDSRVSKAMNSSGVRVEAKVSQEEWSWLAGVGGVSYATSDFHAADVPSEMVNRLHLCKAGAALPQRFREMV